uniref:K+ efflux antiporter 6 n=1 Tax=Rhizophora mucronata TaxID=61149 RepID=A0A2P2M734_RHIMU
MLTRPVFLYVLVLLITYFSWISFGLDVVGPDRLDLGGNTSATNTSLSKPSSFADIIDKALEKEFTENDQNEGSFLVLLIPQFLGLYNRVELSMCMV